MKLSAAVPQEANFSLIGRFGNCQFGGAYGRGALAIRGPPGTSLGVVDLGRRRGGTGPGVGVGRSPALGLGGGRHDLLLDQAEVPRQRTGAQQHGDAVCFFQGEIAGDLARAAGDGLADHGS